MTELVIGGSGSGKSEYAENLCMKIKGKKNKLFYIATMKPYGDEAFKRIEKHRKMRAEKGFETIEKYVNIHELKLENSTVLIECLSNLTANEMFELKEKNAAGKILSGIEKIIKQSKNVVIVTNDIFSEDCIYGKETENYIKTLGEINYMLGKIVDNVTQVLFSVPQKYKEGGK